MIIRIYGMFQGLINDHPLQKFWDTQVIGSRRADLSYASVINLQSTKKNLLQLKTYTEQNNQSNSARKTVPASKGWTSKLKPKKSKTNFQIPWLNSLRQNKSCIKLTYCFRQFVNFNPRAGFLYWSRLFTLQTEKSEYQWRNKKSQVFIGINKHFKSRII